MMKISNGNCMRLCLAALLWLMSLSAAQAAVCSVQTTPLAFGSYLAGIPLTSTATVITTCDVARTPIVVSLSTGNGGSFAPRAMTSGANKINYNLYTDATYQTIWGDGTGGTQTVSGSTVANIVNPAVTKLTKTIYGQIPAKQTVAAGNYSDTIVVTVIW